MLGTVWHISHSEQCCQAHGYRAHYWLSDHWRREERGIPARITSYLHLVSPKEEPRHGSPTEEEEEEEEEASLMCNALWFLFPWKITQITLKCACGFKNNAGFRGLSPLGSVKMYPGVFFVPSVSCQSYLKLGQGTRVRSLLKVVPGPVPSELWSGLFEV